MRELEQSTAANVMVFMTDSTDQTAGKTGLTLTITASKDGAAFASITPTVTERGNGWYNLALTTSHTDTLGNLALHITSTGADPSDLNHVIIAKPEIEGAVSDGTPAAGDFDTDLSASTNELDGMMLYFIDGDLKGIGRKISTFTTTNGQCQFTGTSGDLDAAFPTAPANGDKFRLISFAG